MNVQHDEAHLDWIKRKMRSVGVDDYRFCKESNFYVCDRNGNFYSVGRITANNKGEQSIHYRFIQIFGTVEDGYFKIRVNDNGKRRHVNAHRMMMNAWVGECDSMVINHVDGNKLNNRLDNLEYCTVAKNNEHAIKNHLYVPGSFKSRRYIIPSYEWMTIYVMHKHLGYSFSELGKSLGVSRTAVIRVYRIVENIIPEELR